MGTRRGAATTRSMGRPTRWLDRPGKSSTKCGPRPSATMPSRRWRCRFCTGMARSICATAIRSWCRTCSPRFGLISGQWGTYKTFVVFDLAHAIMSGEPFLGHEVVRRGGVLLVAVEGQNEVAKRLEGVIRDKGKLAHPAPFAWVATCPPLVGADAVAVLSELAARAAARLQAQFGLPLVAIFIDTVVAAAGYT